MVTVKQVNDCAFLAGQISLDPATMALDSSSHTVCDDEEERLKRSGCAYAAEDERLEVRG